MMCAALPDDSLKPGNYASRARPSALNGPHAPKEKQSARTVRPKTLRAKGNKKKAPRNPRGLFSERKVVGNDDAKPEEQRAMFVSRPRAIEGKTSPDGT
jgi:hypothetical protein